MRAGAFRIQVSKGIELRFERGDQAEMRFDKFYWRKFPRANVCGDFRDRGEAKRRGHKRNCESMCRMGCGSSVKRYKGETPIKKIK